MLVVMWALGSATSALKFGKERIQSQELQCKRRIIQHRGRRSEPAGLWGLRKQVTEAKAGPWETGSGVSLGRAAPLVVSFLGTVKA